MTGETPLLDNIPPVFIPSHCDDFTRLCKKIEIYSRQYDGGLRQAKQILDDTVFEILLLLCADAVRETSPIPEPLNNSVAEVCRYIDCNCGHALTIDSLAERMFISTDHLTRLFRREIGMTPSDYIFTVRMKKARFMLESTDESIDQIAGECGYQSAAYFIKRFKAENKITPKKNRAAIFKYNTDAAAIKSDSAQKDRAIPDR